MFGFQRSLQFVLGLHKVLVVFLIHFNFRTVFKQAFKHGAFAAACLVQDPGRFPVECKFIILFLDFQVALHTQADDRCCESLSAERHFVNITATRRRQTHRWSEARDNDAFLGVTTMAVPDPEVRREGCQQTDQQNHCRCIVP